MKIILLKSDEKGYGSFIEGVNADKGCIDILEEKTHLPIFLLNDVCIESANIIKQTALSVGCDAAVSRGVISGKDKISDVVLMCTFSQLKKMSNKLKGQPFKLGESMDEMISIIKNKKSFRVKGRDLLKEKEFLIMGILNATPDSFYDGKKNMSLQDALKRCGKMVEEGADIIDIGGESTRPSSEKVDNTEEMNRVLPLLKEIRREFKSIVISVDTYKSSVADAAIQEGADIINDISGMTFDPQMAEIVGKSGVSAVLMHIKGNPKTMQENPEYKELIPEILEVLKESVIKAEAAGVDAESIAVDPGIGIEKTFKHNFEILNSLESFKTLKKAILVGVSNKAFLGSIDNLPADKRIEPTIAANVLALKNGASIFRVHNVGENLKAIKIASEIINASL